MLSPVLATNFFLFLFSRLINAHFFYQQGLPVVLVCILDSSVSSSKANAGLLF
ncbi:hypothetical protein BSPLISOX_2684 [uncultured Gammaproteobacteria bacterium]|jgi:hypothetical protein|nr:hypothetical protein [uncultured Gammaproteobacteria bacterium]CAC9467849.1 hypothetical protein [uncultured Gammaproteobacteria bacterium]VVH66795.1 hypothetical protein BSPLISOX_2684 [uncultured Gammaproteobacteria bacterium]